MKGTCRFLLMVFLLSGCGSKPLPRPFVEKRGKGSKKPVTKVEERKVGAGKVTFAGLGERELASIRVIPEEGKALFRPGNRSYDQVDGFWWSGERDEWFKIPDLSEAWVGTAPGKYDEVAHRGGLKIYFQSKSLVGFLGDLAGKITRPGWVPNSGGTASPVNRPAGL